jgi:hypothetical protein
MPGLRADSSCPLERVNSHTPLAPAGLSAPAGAVAAKCQSCTAASMVSRRTGQVVSELERGPGIHRILPETRILPDLAPAGRTTAHTGLIIRSRPNLRTCSLNQALG